jgi:hypothetical protein
MRLASDDGLFWLRLVVGCRSAQPASGHMILAPFNHYLPLSLLAPSAS